MFTKRGSSSSAFGHNLYLARVLKTTYNLRVHLKQGYRIRKYRKHQKYFDSASTIFAPTFEYQKHRSVNTTIDAIIKLTEVSSMSR